MLLLCMTAKNLTSCRQLSIACMFVTSGVERWRLCLLCSDLCVPLLQPSAVPFAAAHGEPCDAAARPA
jgi:hypothetical protein